MSGERPLAAAPPSAHTLPQEPMSTPTSESESVDVAAIMRQIRRQISERRERQDDRALEQALRDANQSWDKVFAPLQLPPAGSLPGRAWELLRTRLHQEVRGYLDAMIFRQTEFNAAVVRALNALSRRGDAPAADPEVEALRDELIQLREEVRQLRERLGRAE